LSTTAENPNCATCGTTLQALLYGMPDYAAYSSGKYHIMGCTIDDVEPAPEWWCPECEIFVP